MKRRLAGIGFALTLTLLLGVRSADARGKIAFTPHALSFGRVQVGTSLAKSVTLTNNTKVAINISHIATTGTVYSASQNCLGMLAAGGGTCEVSVTFSPIQAKNPEGTKVTGTLTINDNATNSPQKVSLSGVAFGPAVTPTPTPTPTTGAISGTATGQLIGRFAGACGIGYSGYCPSGNCLCDEFTGTVNAIPAGEGTAQGAATIDQGAAVSGGSNTCLPVFVSLEIQFQSGLQVINGVGAACVNATGYALSGGFGVAEGGSGWGTITGNFYNSGEVVINYSGND